MSTTVRASKLVLGDITGLASALAGKVTSSDVIAMLATERSAIRTLNNARIVPRIVAPGAVSGTFTVDSDATDVYVISLIGAISITVTGTPMNGQSLRISVMNSSGSLQAAAWDSAVFENPAVLPANITPVTQFIYDFAYNTQTGKWRLAVDMPIDVYRAAGTDIAVTDGGTGRSGHTAYTLLAGGTTGTGSQQSLVAGTAGQILRSNGAAAVPSWASSRSIVSVAANTTFPASTGTDYVYILTAAATYTMPTAVSNTSLYTLKNTSAVAVTISTTSSQTIEGKTTFSLPSGSAVDLISTNTNWVII